MQTLTLPQYLIESSICLTAFYLLYVTLLKKETFFQLNRFYLLTSAIASVVIPFLEFNVDNPSDVLPVADLIMPTLNKMQISHMSLIEIVEAPSPLIISVGDIIRLIYGLGIFIMGMKFFDALFKVINLIGRGQKEKIGDNTLVTHDGKVPSSSFFSYIFWNDKDSGKGKDVHSAIIDHELVHVRQWHSLDVICMEILVILKWFNPLIYLFRKSLRLTHEFIADRYVTQQTNKLAYANILIGQSQSTPAPRLSHTFYSDIKQRIQMLGKIKSSHWRLCKGLAILPVFFSLLCLFSFDFTDRIAVIADSMDHINNAYDAIEATEVIALNKWTDIIDGLESESTASENLIIFRWGSLVYNNGPEEHLEEGTIFHNDSLTIFQLRNSIEKKPMFFADNTYWYEYSFDFTLEAGLEKIKHTITVNQDFDIEDWQFLFENVSPQKVIIDNFVLRNSQIDFDFYFEYEIEDVNFNNVSYSNRNYIFNSPERINGYYEVTAPFSDKIIFPLFWGGVASDLQKLKKEELTNLVLDRKLIYDTDTRDDMNLEDYDINIIVYRDVVADSTIVIEGYQLHKLIERTVHNFRIEEQLDYTATIDDRVLFDWFESLDDGDMISVIFSEKGTDENERMSYNSLKDSIVANGSYMPSEFTFRYQVSEYPDLYTPNLELSSKYAGAIEESMYQIIYRNDAKTLIKIDRMDPENDKIISAFADASKFELLHIPNYRTKYRVVEYKDEYLSSPKTVITSLSGIDGIDIHRLPEYDIEESEPELSWGGMISLGTDSNCSIKQFHKVRKINPMLKAGNEEYRIMRFTMYIIDKNDKVQAFQSSYTKAYELNKVLQDINEETSIYFDDIIIDVEGEWHHVMNRFAYILE